MKQKPSFAIVGGTSMLGRELRDVFEALPTPVDLRLVGAEEGEAAGLAEDAGEPVVVSPLDEDNLTNATVVFLAGGAKSSQQAWDLLALRKQRPFVVDLSGALARVPKAQLRAPLVEAPGFEVLPESVQVIAHPASVAIAILLRKLRDASPLASMMAHLFLPVSEQGNAGIDELHRQMVDLLGFQNMPKAVFDEQVAFNMLARWGEEASAGTMLSVEDSIRAELPRLIDFGKLPPLSLRCLQAAVFHCLSGSIHLRFAQPVEMGAVAEWLRGDLVDLWSQEQGSPNHLSAVGESGIVLGDLRPDPALPHAYWLWMVADNLRLRAASAVAAARIWLV